MAKKHISRKYSAHKQSVVRPMDEFFEVEILSFDPKYTIICSMYDQDYASLNNAQQTNRTNWSCLQSKDGTYSFQAHMSYVVDEFGEYRFDCLYEKKDTRNYTGRFSIIDSSKNEVVDDVFLCDGDTDTLKRKSFFYELKPDTYDIRFVMPVNTWLMGCIGRKIIKFLGNSQDGSGTNMLVSSATVSKTKDTSPAELSMTIGYDNSFECSDSPSGFYMDYRDEVNCYVRDEYDSLQQVFGGYLSSVLPNDKMTTMTVTAVDRLSDGNKKYIMEAMSLLGGTSSHEDYTSAMTHDFDTYGEALKHLCDLCEESLQNNVNENFLVAGENYNNCLTATFGSKGTVKSVKTVNMTSTVSDNFITVRNNPDASKVQYTYLYDIQNYNTSKIDITDYPNFYFTYGVGDPKTEEKTGDS